MADVVAWAAIALVIYMIWHGVGYIIGFFVSRRRDKRRNIDYWD